MVRDRYLSGIRVDMRTDPNLGNEMFFQLDQEPEVSLEELMMKHDRVFVEESPSQEDCWSKPHHHMLDAKEDPRVGNEVLKTCFLRLQPTRKIKHIMRSQLEFQRFQIFDRSNPLISNIFE
jgi:hypothetical protein